MTLTGRRARARAYEYSSTVIIRRRLSLSVTDSGTAKTLCSPPLSSWNGTGMCSGSGSGVSPETASSS